MGNPIIMVIDLVHRFVDRSRQNGVKGSDPEVKELMTELRRSGFTSQQISKLSGNRWSSTLVRQYTGNWNEVDTELDNQRRSIIETLRELVSSNVDINEVEHVVLLEKQVKNKGSSILEVAELSTLLDQFTLQPREISKLVNISRYMQKENINPNTIQFWINLDQSLIEDGLTKQERLYLSEACQKYGGVIRVMKGVNQYIDLRNLESQLSGLEVEVEILTAKKNQLDMTISSNQDMIDAVRTAYFIGFNPMSLGLVSSLAENLGDPSKVLEAVKKYGSIVEIDNKLMEKRKELNIINNEITNKQSHRIAVDNILHRSSEVYKRNEGVIQVVRLLDEISGSPMDRGEVVAVLIKVLESSLTRLEEAKQYLPDTPDPLWENTVVMIGKLADSLRKNGRI